MKKKKYILVVLFSVLMLGGLYAQPSGGGGDSGGPVDAGAVPIGANLVLVVIAGIGYGTKKLLDEHTTKR